MTQRLGMITVGQSPREDIIPAMSKIIGANIETVEKGALDGFSDEDILSMAPQRDEVRLCTRLSDDRQVVVAKDKIIPLVQAKIHDLNQESVDLIVLLCTGQFPTFESNCLVIEAEKIVDRCIEALITDRQTIGLFVPLAEQMGGARQKLLPITPKIHVVSATPYGSMDETQKAAERLREDTVDLVILHCMGFTDEHRRIVRQVVKKPVLVANSIVARTVAELMAT